MNFELKRVDIEASTAKDSDHRQVPLNKDALNVLTRWRWQCEPVKSDAYVFVGRDRKPLRTIDTEWCQIRASGTRTSQAPKARRP